MSIPRTARFALTTRFTLRFATIDFVVHRRSGLIRWPTACYLRVLRVGFTPRADVADLLPTHALESPQRERSRQRLGIRSGNATASKLSDRRMRR